MVLSESKDDQIFIKASQQYEDTIHENSEDDQIFIEASQQYEDTVHESSEDDTIYLEASQQFEAEFVEQYIKDCCKYEHMDEDHFGLDKLMAQTSQPQRFGPTVTESLKKIHDAVPKTMRRTMDWAVNLWKEWIKHIKKALRNRK